MRIPGALGVTLLLGLTAAGPAWARGGGGCLAQGTSILTPQGPVAIERLRPGDQVCTVTGSQLSAATVHARTEFQPREYLELVVADRRLRVTREHPFQIGPGVFCRAGDLRPGVTLWLWEHASLKPAPLRSITVVAAERPAYNLLVAPGGTYLAEGVVVHNKGCFLPDTPIVRADGSRTAIRDLRAGDRLLAFTPDGIVTSTSVLHILCHEVEQYVVVETDHLILRVTPDHPFYVGAGTFRTLEALHPGDAIYAYDGRGLSKVAIRRLEYVQQPTRVYNLQTDAPHTFLANGIAVHNKGGGGGGGGRGGGFSSRGGGHGGSSANGEPVRWRGERAAIIFPAGTGSGAVIGGSLRAARNRRKGAWRQFFIGALIGGSGIFLALLLALASVPVAVLVGVVALIGAIGAEKADKKEEDLDFVYSPAAVAAKAAKTQKLLLFLAKQDSSMAPERLKETAESTFRKLQECWQARDYGPMRPLLMPDLYAQHCAQLEAMKVAHEINLIADLQIDRVDVVHLRYTDKPENREFTALITARARDYYVDERTQAFLRGDRAPAPFQEFWTFHRQGDAWLLRDIEQSRESDFLKEESFVEMFTDRQLQLVYAEAARGQGEAGPWLEQEVETKATRIERLLNFLVHTDPRWNEKRMKERAREVFTRVYLAQEAGDPNVVPTADLFPDVAAHLREAIARRRKAGTTVEYRNLCVRKVEIVLVRNYRDNSADEFTVRLSAHAQKVTRQQGTVVSQDEYVTPFEEYWTFGPQQNEWKLKEVLPPAGGERLVETENVDEESSPAQLQWYYRHSRAG